ncbi:MAG: 5-formyltetrahydrofolate cyclo-ligase [Ruminococcaceae bacterium]|nr:5-formyltetrahydrofolate cyclo-ligase [Oscillospiraceae bacterium]
MQIKNELRKLYKLKRKSVINKADKDKLISEKLYALEAYKSCKTVLTYVSLDDEIKTDDIIIHSLKAGKRVAVPYCKDDMGNMDFYLIDSLTQLSIGSFSVREPDINECERINSFNDSIAIVPGLIFDKNGYRIGYGKGYYDRFLNEFNGISIGLCYDELLTESLPIDKHDKNVDILITPGTTICNRGGKNG